MIRRMALTAAFICTLVGAKAQWVVADPTNFAGNIANTINEIATSSKTVQNTMAGFREMEKLYDKTKKYYDELRKVNNLIGDAFKVKECILIVGDISKTYVSSYRKMLSDRNYRPAELAAMASGYTRMMKLSGECLKELKAVTTSGTLSMNDYERMDRVDRIYSKLVEYKSMVDYFTMKNISVSYVRARKNGDMQRVSSLYGSDASRFW